MQAKVTIGPGLGVGFSNPVVAGDYIWLTSSLAAPEQMYRVDPATNTARAMGDLARGGEFVAGTSTELWVSWNSQTWRSGLPDGGREETLPVGGQPTLGDGGLWIASDDGYLYGRPSPRDDLVRISPLPNDAVPTMAYADGSLWATWGGLAPAELVRLDPIDGSVVARLSRVGDVFATDGAELWAEDPGHNGISRIDTVSNTVSATVHISHGIIDAAVMTPNHVWVVGDRLYSIDRRSLEVTSYSLPQPDVGSLRSTVLASDGSLWLYASGQGGAQFWRLALQ